MREELQWKIIHFIDQILKYAILHPQIYYKLKRKSKPLNENIERWHFLNIMVETFQKSTLFFMLEHQRYQLKTEKTRISAIMIDFLNSSVTSIQHFEIWNLNFSIFKGKDHIIIIFILDTVRNSRCWTWKTWI